MALSLSKTCHAPFAATVTAFSTYLIGLCITWMDSLYLCIFAY